MFESSTCSNAADRRGVLWKMDVMGIDGYDLASLLW